MTDTVMTIIGIFLAALLMFIYPLMAITGKNDEIAQTVVEVAVADFVREVTSNGKITELDYEKLVQKISATGNTFDVQLEVQLFDDNNVRHNITKEQPEQEEQEEQEEQQGGTNKYYSIYTNDILNKIEKENGVYLLKKYDQVKVTVKNTNITLGTQLKNVLYNLIGKETYTLGTTSTGVVVNGGI